MPSGVLLRNSERGAYKTCQFKWALNFGAIPELSAEPVRSTEPAKALWFGDLVHQALARYYKPGRKRGPKPAATFLQLYDADERSSAVLKNDDGEWESMRDLGHDMLVGYVEEYKGKDQEWEVIASERTFRLPITVPPFVIPGTEDTVILPAFKLVVVGTVDGLWRNVVDRDRLVFKEFKTAASINVDGLGMDDQAGFYWTYGPKWLWRQRLLKRGEYPSEILYTFLRKARRNPDKTYDAEGRLLNKPTKANLTERFPKLDKSLTLEGMIGVVGEEAAALTGEPSKSQPPPFFEREPVYRDANDRASLHQRVLAEAREMQLKRAGILPIYKNPGPLHAPNCRGCLVRDACELHETGSDWRSMLAATTERWDPYAAHELTERR